MKILLIDDDKVITNMYSTKFRESGWETMAAGSVAEATEIVEEGFVPDLVVLDIIMPGENGVEFLKRIKKVKNLAGVKVILLSNLDYRAEADQEISSLASGYYLKADITPSELSKKIHDLF